MLVSILLSTLFDPINSIIYIYYYIHNNKKIELVHKYLMGHTGSRLFESVYYL